MKKINNSRKEYSNIDKKNVKWIEGRKGEERKRYRKGKERKVK